MKVYKYIVNQITTKNKHIELRYTNANKCILTGKVVIRNLDLNQE